MWGGGGGGVGGTMVGHFVFSFSSLDPWQCLSVLLQIYGLTESITI